MGVVCECVSMWYRLMNVKIEEGNIVYRGTLTIAKEDALSEDQDRCLCRSITERTSKLR